MADTVAPLCSAAEFTIGAFADLATDYPTDALDAALAEATRMTEEEVGLRLAPFTGLTETVRVAAIGPDEHNTAPRPRAIPAAPQAYDPVAFAQIRHFWLEQKPLRYPDLWTWDLGAIVTSGPNSFAITDVIYGPDDQGHVWVLPPYWLPPGSRVQPTYGGGYTVAVPASLSRACKLLAAELIVREFDPDEPPTTHDPSVLHEDALMILSNWAGGKT